MYILQQFEGYSLCDAMKNTTEHKIDMRYIFYWIMDSMSDVIRLILKSKLEVT